jgi:elongation factor P
VCTYKASQPPSGETARPVPAASGSRETMLTAGHGESAVCGTTVSRCAAAGRVIKKTAASADRRIERRVERDEGIAETISLTNFASPGYNVFGVWVFGTPRPILRPQVREGTPKQNEAAMTVKATQLRPGMVIRHEGELYTVFSVDHRTPGNKRGSMQTRMRSLRTGSIVDYRFRAEEFVERAILDEIEFEYLYNDGDGFHFMNTENFDQITLSRDILGDAVEYLIPNIHLNVEFYEGKPIGVVLPDTVDLQVVETEPGIKSATASSVTKPAKLETGLVIQVPPFINEGERVKVDTTEGRYIQRAQ